jgi:phenylpropionate dioxygenase-like ring-hydroxylating dioxygenase large terminal subunit
MSDWRPDLPHHWSVVALSRTLTRTPHVVEAWGLRWALARGASGEAFALADRCPHRGVPLSRGCVEGDGLRCAYHGWKFDGQGRCVDVPGWPPAVAPPAIRVPSLAVVERDGLVWAAQRPAVRETLPALVTALDPPTCKVRWQGRWGAPALECLENTLDSLHTHFIHAGLVRRDARRSPAAATLERTAEGFKVEYTGLATQSGWIYRLFESRRVAERGHFAGPGIAQLEYRYANGAAFWITLCFTPESADATHVFATVHIAGRWAPAWAVRSLFGPFLARVAQQDQTMLELQTQNLRRFPAHRHVVTRLDLARLYLESWWRKSDDELADSVRVELML